MGYARIFGYDGICLDMLGYGRIWWEKLHMVGCAGMCWDMVGHGGIWGGLHVVRRPCTCFAKSFFVVPHGFYICLERFLN